MEFVSKVLAIKTDLITSESGYSFSTAFTFRILLVKL